MTISRRSVVLWFCVLSLNVSVALAGSEHLFSSTAVAPQSGWEGHAGAAAKKAGGSLTLLDGKARIKVPESVLPPHELQLVRPIDVELDSGYRLGFTVETDRTGMVEIVYGTRNPPYISYCRTWLKLKAGKHDYECGLAFKKNKTGKDQAPRLLRFYFGSCKGAELTVSNLTLEALQPLTLSESWQLFLKVKPPETFSRRPKTLTGPQGKSVTAQTVKLKNNVVNLGEMTGKAFQEGDTAVLYNEFECQKSGLMQLGVAADWWMEVYVNGKTVFGTMKNGNGVQTFAPADHTLYVPVKAGKNLLAVKVQSGSNGWLFACGIPETTPPAAPVLPNVKITADAVWKPVDMAAVAVQENSALDLSSLVDAPAGKHGRVIVGPGGFLAFAGQPSRSVRLHGFNGVGREIWQYGSDRDFRIRAVAFAQAVRRQGYSLVRLNMFECFICADAKKDMEINPKFMDRWDFLMAALKAEGVYSHLVIASYGLFWPNAFASEVYRKRNVHKLKMYLGSEWERTHWRYGAETLLNHVNPYTSLAWKDDPSLAVVEFYNEQEIGIKHIPETIEKDPETRALLERKWREWLKNKFKGQLPPEFKGIVPDQAPIPNMRGETELTNQFSLFLGDLARESASWCEKVARKTGYQGLTTQYNFSKTIGDSAVRWELDQVVEMNGYFNHPSQGMRPGSQIAQTSSVEKSADYWRGINSTRLAGRPMLVSEHNHCFWNRYQHEGGLVFGAYSALQGYSSIMIHSGPVVLKLKNHIVENFSSGSSPIVRANEFLSACLFRRGDVQTSPHRLELRIPRLFLMTAGNGFKAVNSEQGKLALITGFALSFPELPRPQGIPVKLPPSSLTLLPAGGGIATATEWSSSVLDSNDGSFSLVDTVAKLKSSGLLPKSNLSDPAREVFQSDTGEITMRAKEKLFKVVTPRTEAVSLEAGKRETLNLLRVENSSVPAAVALCSVDGRSLDSSARMVLIYSTAAANTGMELSNNGVGMVNPGKSPVLLQTGTLNAVFKNGGGTKFSLYALGFDGSRRERLPLQSTENGLEIKLDTGALKNGPTTFFELTAEQ